MTDKLYVWEDPPPSRQGHGGRGARKDVTEALMRIAAADPGRWARLTIPLPAPWAHLIARGHRFPGKWESVLRGGNTYVRFLGFEDEI